jgi:hypothetical protein
VASAALGTGLATNPAVGTNYDFVSATATVTVAAGQSVLVISNAELSASSSLASTLNLGIGYEIAGGSVQLAFPKALSFAANTTVEDYGLSAVITGLSPGTYQVGLVASSSASGWSASGSSATSALVLN